MTTLFDSPGAVGSPESAAPGDETRPVVVGLDLSLTASGYAGPDGTKVFRSIGHKGDTLTQRAERLDRLGGEIVAATLVSLPKLVLVEAPSFGQQRQGGTHDRSGLWWLVVNSLIKLDRWVLEVPPATLKKYLTGSGVAKKPDMRMALYKRFDIDIADDNEADAFALRAIGLDLLGYPLVDMPIAHRAALAKLPRPVAGRRP